MKIETVVRASRPKTLGISVGPVLLGAGLAWQADSFSLPVTAITVAAALSIQITANFANDLFDFLQGVDGDNRLGPPRMTATGMLSPRSAAVLTALSAGSAVLFGLPLVLTGGLPILVVGVSAIFCAVAYSAGPYPLGKFGLGELFVFIYFGPVAVLGSYYLQAGPRFSYVHLLGGGAVGLLGVALLAVNNLRDISTDAGSGKRTLAVRFGREFGRLEIYASIAGAFTLLSLTGFTRRVPFICSLSGLTVVPLIAFLFRVGRKESGPWMNNLLARVSLTVFSVGLSVFLLCTLPW